MANTAKPASWEHVVYQSVTAAALPVHLAQLAYRWYRGQETVGSTRQRLGCSSKARPNGPLVWFHTANIGESAVALPVVFRCLLDYNENVHLLLTTGTQESYELLANTLPARVILQLAPVDAPLAAWLFVRKWRPQIGIFMEGELKPNLLEAAARAGVKLALLNAKLSSQVFLEWHSHPRARSLMTRMVSHLALIIPQSDLDVGRFRMMGATLQQMPGWCADLKYAAAMGSSLWHVWRPSPEKIIALKKAVAGRALWVAANTHEAEDEAVARVHLSLRKEHPRLLTVLAPRQPARAPAICRMLSSLGLSHSLWSHTPRCYAVDVVVVDVAGELPAIFSAAEIVFVGHSLFPECAGGQNLAEAAVAGCALLVGRHAGHFGHMAEELNTSALQAAEEAAAAVTNSSPMNDELYEPYASSSAQDAPAAAPHDAPQAAVGVGHQQHQAAAAGGEGGQQHAGGRVAQQLSNWSHSALEEAVLLRMPRPSTAPAALASSTVTTPRRPATPATPTSQPDTPTSCHSRRHQPHHDPLHHEPGSPSRIHTPTYTAHSPAHPHSPTHDPHHRHHPHDPLDPANGFVDSEPGSPVARFRRRAMGGLRMRVVANQHHDETMSLGSESLASTPSHHPHASDTPGSRCYTPSSQPPPTSSHPAAQAGSNILYLPDSPHSTFGPPLRHPSHTTTEAGPTLTTIFPQAASSLPQARPRTPPHAPHDPQPSTHAHPAPLPPSSTPFAPALFISTPQPSPGASRMATPSDPTPLPPPAPPSQEILSARLVGPPPEPQLRILTTEPDPRKPSNDPTSDPAIATSTPCSTPPCPTDPSPAAAPATAPPHPHPSLPNVRTSPLQAPAAPLSSSAPLPAPPPAAAPAPSPPTSAASTPGAPNALISELSFSTSSFNTTLDQLLHHPPSSPPPHPADPLPLQPPSAHTPATCSSAGSTPRFGQGTSYSSPTARWRRRRSHYGDSPTSPADDPPAPLPADAATRTAPLSRLHRRSTFTDDAPDYPQDPLSLDADEPPKASAAAADRQAGSQHAPQDALWNNSSYCEELHIPCTARPPSQADSCSSCATHHQDHHHYEQQQPPSPLTRPLSPSSSSGDHTPSWMETPVSMGPTVDGAPTRAPWHAAPPFTPRLPRHEEGLDLAPPATPDSPALTTTHLLNSRRYQDRQDLHAGMSYMRYAGEYILPATHLPYNPHGPAVWKVSAEAGLSDAVGLLLREPLERRSRGHAAAQAAAKLASGLVSTVWHFLDDIVVTPALHDYVRSTENAAAGGGGGSVGGGAGLR